MTAKDTTKVLFVCYLNSIRSPMAEGLARQFEGLEGMSCGLETGELDDLMVAVMREKNIDMSAHQAQSLESLADQKFDVVVAFTETAGEAAKAVFGETDTEVLIWPTPDPTAGMLDVRAMMNNYRSVRDFIEGRLKKRFGKNASF